MVKSPEGQQEAYHRGPARIGRIPPAVACPPGRPTHAEDTRSAGPGRSAGHPAWRRRVRSAYPV